MTTRRVHRRASRQGGNAIEFALCMPIWIAIVTAIMEFSWIFYQAVALDAATNMGCRAGSLIDPGDFDANIAEVNSVASDKMRRVLMDSSLQTDDCSDCVVTTHTSGAPPSRTLVCQASRQVTPLIGAFVGTQYMNSVQIARLEWQREAAPL